MEEEWRRIRGREERSRGGRGVEEEEMKKGEEQGRSRGGGRGDEEGRNRGGGGEEEDKEEQEERRRGNVLTLVKTGWLEPTRRRVMTRSGRQVYAHISMSEVPTAEHHIWRDLPRT